MTYPVTPTYYAPQRQETQTGEHEGSNMADLEFYDPQNNYYYGKIKAGGKIEIYDQDNIYYYSKLKG